jgi:hypothetical protein
MLDLEVYGFGTTVSVGILPKSLPVQMKGRERCLYNLYNSKATERAIGHERHMIEEEEDDPISSRKSSLSRWADSEAANLLSKMPRMHVEFWRKLTEVFGAIKSSQIEGD